MDILEQLSSKFRVDASEGVSTELEIGNLVKFSDIKLPNDFLELIRKKTSVEINVDGMKYIRIWGAVDCIEMNEAYKIQKDIPNSLAIGDDEGGNALIYAVGEKGFGLYIVSFEDFDMGDSKYVSNSLSDLLINNIGLDVIKNYW